MEIPEHGGVQVIGRGRGGYAFASVDADEFATLKRKIEKTPPSDMRAVQDHLSRTMEQALRDGNRARAEDYKELLRIALRPR